MGLIKITTTQNIDIEYELSGIGERIAGNVLDNLVKGAYLFITLMIFSGMHLTAPFDWMYLVFLVFFPFSFYSLASELLMNGQTIGKRIVSIRVVSLDGAPCSAGQYIIRWLFQPIDFYITFWACAVVTVAFSKHNQRLGDMIAGTIVIKTGIRTTFQQTMFVAPAQIPDYTITFPEAAHLTDKEMQLVKDVIINVQQTGNSVIAYHAAEKIKQTIQVQSNLEPMVFLQVLLADHNHLASIG